MQPVDINGTEPAIVGQVCQDLVAVAYLYRGELVEPANVIFLRFLDCWHRLYFDYGIIFWRSAADGPSGFVAKELDAEYHPVDLAKQYDLKGKTLLELTYEGLPNGSAVRLAFADGRALTFRCADDVTTYA